MRSAPDAANATASRIRGKKNSSPPYQEVCMRLSFRRLLFVPAILFAVGISITAQTSPSTPDIPPKFEAPTNANDYVKREVMIPMRDGVKLHTVIVVPRGAKNAPMILTRTPYNASKRAERND